MIAREYLRTQPPIESLLWSAEYLGGTLQGAVFLEGGRSHANHLVTTKLADGRERKAVLRRWTRPGWAETDPDFDVRREMLALRLAREQKIPAPGLIAADPDAEYCDVPALLMEFAAGQSPGEDLAVEDLTGGLARVLRLLHATPVVSAAKLPPYRVWNEGLAPVVPRYCQSAHLWLRAIAVVASGTPASPNVFIHRDFHPGNTLWSGSELVSVVDWTYASWGPAEVDLAHMRWNLACSHGVSVADEFLSQYGELQGSSVSVQRYWDLRTVVDLLPESEDWTIPAEQVPMLEAHLERLL